MTRSVLSKEGLLGNTIALKAVAALVVLQLAMTHLPFKQGLFGTDHLDAETWLRVVAAGMLVFAAIEIEKLFWRRRPAP